MKNEIRIRNAKEVKEMLGLYLAQFNSKVEEIEKLKRDILHGDVFDYNKSEKEYGILKVELDYLLSRISVLHWFLFLGELPDDGGRIR